MSIISKEDLLNKQKEVQKNQMAIPAAFSSVQVPDVLLPVLRKYMMKCQSSALIWMEGAGGDAERYSPSWRGKNRMPGSL